MLGVIVEDFERPLPINTDELLADLELALKERKHG
jgi:hypothetical protein